MRFAALMAATMMSMTTFAQMNDSILTDSTMWFNQTQELSGVVVKGRLPKTRAKRRCYENKGRRNDTGEGRNRLRCPVEDSFVGG